ncbi:methionine biosynthesis PLP-dependent protein [Bacillus massilinigeriensis]|uniref:methionine biosynthesis PLP-dependent protein n=1 Tax=Bacillus mediterraneensis TaxID=1805474 RepID=UPI0008F8D511|nr:methionine biosynthesis PLP-dependent protein [Bacillus mediterraneensis]
MVKIDTALAQIGNRSEHATGAVSAPIYLTTAYRHGGIGESSGYDYVRTGNPTREVLEKAIADLEGGDRGFACSSGMAAIWTVLSLFSSEDELIVSKDLYGGTYRLMEQGFAKWGLHSVYVDMSDEEAITAAITPRTKALFVETPTNPLMEQADIGAIAKIAQSNGLLFIVDNTFYTPLLQKPLTLGADIVLHSATKYLGGHNDVLAGLIVAKGQELCNELFLHHNGGGAVLSPFDSWLLIRGMKTLSLRMERHERNAKSLVQYLKTHEAVTDVLYPGRGGMLSFRLKNSSMVNPFLQSLQTITFAESLGGVESLITYPTTQTHADIPEEIREKSGVCKRLLRFSVGIEDAEDLAEDLGRALEKAAQEVCI